MNPAASATAASSSLSSSATADPKGSSSSSSSSVGLFVPERIILAIDLSREMLSSEFDASTHESSAPAPANAPTLTRLKVLQDCLVTFVLAKSEFNPAHEYAVCVLLDGAVKFVQDFTASYLQTIDTILSLKAGADYRAFDVSQLFAAVVQRCPEVVHFTSSRVPDKTVRLILAFGRSFVVPTCSDLALRERLIASRFFFFDTLYLHAKAGVNGACPQQIFDFFTFCSQADATNAALSETPKSSYVFECTARASRLHAYVCKLLAHPLQRETDQDVLIPGN
jgi:hypothetical protein